VPHPDHRSRPSVDARHAGTCAWCGGYFRKGTEITALPEPMYLPDLSWDGRYFRLPGERDRGAARGHGRSWAHARCVTNRSDVELFDEAAERDARIDREKAHH
jgi:hypothetical protein